MQIVREFSESQTNLLPKPGTDSRPVSSSHLDYNDTLRHSTSLTVCSNESGATTPRASMCDNEIPKAGPDRAGTHSSATHSRQRYGSLGQYQSEEAYLNDLRAWIEAKKYFSPGELATGGNRTLEGFYGRTTMDEYASRPGLGLRSRRRENKDQRERKGQRRATIDETAKREEEDSSKNQEENLRRRKSSITDLLRRQRTR